MEPFRRAARSGRVRLVKVPIGEALGEALGGSLGDALGDAQAATSAAVQVEFAEIRRILGERTDADLELGMLLGRTLSRLSDEVVALRQEVSQLRSALASTDAASTDAGSAGAGPGGDVGPGAVGPAGAGPGDAVPGAM